MLVVDDDPMLRELMRFVLEFDGLTPVEVADTKTADVELDGCDLVILDIMLPGESGLQYLRRLPSDHPPVIVLTALHDKQTANDALEAGADCVVTKPFDVTKLLHTIRDLLSQTGHSRQGEDQRATAD